MKGQSEQHRQSRYRATGLLILIFSHWLTRFDTFFFFNIFFLVYFCFVQGKYSNCFYDHLIFIINLNWFAEMCRLILKTISFALIARF